VQFANIKAIYEGGVLYEVDPIKMMSVIYGFNAIRPHSVYAELKLQQAIQQQSV
jgi:hypothetical protein